IASCVAASLSFVQSVSLFFWTAYLVNNEDKYLERIGANENRIVTSTRIAMYSLQMIFAPIHAIAAAIIVFLLYGNLSSLSEEKVTHGYFLSEPQLGHQNLPEARVSLPENPGADRVAAGAGRQRRRDGKRVNRRANKRDEDAASMNELKTSTAGASSGRRQEADTASPTTHSTRVPGLHRRTTRQKAVPTDIIHSRHYSH
ncbi:hypothetical protein ANCDUO_11344, partial [Ancylostoma duodenale]